MSQWISNLTVEYSKANNGKAEKNTATLVNRYNDPIPGVRVRFVMPLGHSYSVSKGEIHQEFNGDQFHIVDVAVDLDATSTTEVQIF